MKFAEEYTFNCVSLKKYYRLPIVSSETSIIVNYGKSSIIKVQEQKLLNSWTLENPHCFTSPIASNQETDLFCVIDDSTVLKWSSNDETLKTAFKFEFQEKIFTVLAVQSKQPIILFSSGKVLPTELLHISLNPIGEEIFNEEELIWADTFVIHSEIKIICLTQNKVSQVYKLHELSMKKRNIYNHSFMDIDNGSQTLKNWCLNKFNFSFIAIWSNGFITSYFHLNKQPTTLLTLPDVKDSSLFAITVLDADHIAIAEYVAENKETILQMWDTKFTSLTAKKVLKTVCCDFLQMEAVNHSLYLLLNDSLVEVPYIVQKSTLATALGKLSEISSPVEYCWEDETPHDITDTNSKAENDESGLAQDSSNIISLEPMDIEEKIVDLELLAQRFVEEGSHFLTNNQECDIFDLLKFALKLKLKKKVDKLDPDEILNAVFSSTFLEKQLVQKIRNLNIREIVILLDTLLGLIETKSANTDSATEIQLFEWLFLIMKTHTESLLLSKEKKKTKLLKRLEQCISKNLEAYEDYLKIQNIMYMLQKEEKLIVNKPSVGKYFVDVINI